jgi:integrase
VDVHKFRATAATRWSAKFKPQDVQKMLGHKSLLTTMRYLVATDQVSPEFVEKIEAA